ncbi:undecaprenyl-phosphate glucose phosphotransferase [Flavobacterium sp. NRK1]|uniref:undecaprenyl-phosphate glucose phosphotransferase n=1 Tax=Flavobacterium sp. NRK1 TaxID=2954929 RepID=UPI002091F042|nr:undecaprenyl-phosphate glucose phosphotransferase [Flavobacterium sp. NRK1]MCO6147658.1 undecaprenyl-phosphate glucose phosphotransferase [Flavobacterium sp. NRK1]
MVLSSRGRYSKYLRPISISFDILTITLLPFYFFKHQELNYFHFCLYQIVSWSIISYFSGFYNVYRYTTIVRIFSKLITQIIIFLLTVIAFFPFAKKTIFSSEAVISYIITVFVAVTVFKLLLFFYLKKYRTAGSNIRNTIIIGYTPQAINMKNLFDTKPEYGYHFKGFFSDKKQNEFINGKIDDIESFVLENKIDDIYCSLNELNSIRLRELVAFCEINNIVIKFIPDSKEIFSRNLTVDYYEFFPVLSFRKTPLHEPVAMIAKRAFDIVFSFLIIIFVLSWLTPIMIILIKMESKGPVFYMQKRAGMNEEQFSCFKFRSMRINNQMDKLAVKNDPRVTKVGKFIRKTSIDELPQFINVLKGDMSVVGPRPHIYSINHRYSIKIKKYGARHAVKPGITGLAQVRGFRGEINSDEDMINRIKYDVFYIENWSILLDIKIILQTIVGMFGDEKAY